MVWPTLGSRKAKEQNRTSTGACSVLFLSLPQSEGWPHHGRTFSIYLHLFSIYAPVAKCTFWATYSSWGNVGLCWKIIFRLPKILFKSILRYKDKILLCILKAQHTIFKIIVCTTLKITLMKNLYRYS